MRLAALAFAVSTLALAACNSNAPGGGVSADVSDAFPDLAQASYRAEGTIMRGDQSLPIVMIRDGRKLRMELTTAEGQTTIIADRETGESFIVTNAGGALMAVRTSDLSSQVADPVEAWSGDLAATATRSGACSGAGQSGAEWTRTEDGEVKTVCVTSDGILLKVTDDGRTVWETTQVERGPQSADLFAAPAGVQVMDLNSIPGVADALARAKAAAGGQ